MNLFRPLPRGIALIGLLVCCGMSATPTFAAPADVAMLRGYIGDWRGRGILTGADSETVVCRLSLTDGNDDKVNYAGRCVLAGNNLSMNGTLAYIDAKKRFEAAMTSNATFTGVAIGQKRNGGVIFNLHERDKVDGTDGEDVTITAQIVLAGGKIDVQFEVVYEQSGGVVRAEVPFIKQ